MRSRVERAAGLLAEHNADALWVEPSANFTYLFGIDLLSLERLCGVLVSRSGDLRAVVPAMHAEEFDALPTVERFTWSDTDGASQAVRACLKGVRRLLVGPTLPAWALFELRNDSGAELAVDSNILTSLRAVKDADEVEQLRHAATVTDGVVEWISTEIARSSTEADLAGRIKRRYLELGHDELIVLIASGAHAAMPHHLAGDAGIEADRPLLADIGARIGAYWSDTTRIFLPHGDDRAVSDAYDAVVTAYEAALAAAGPGVACEDVDRAARSVIENVGLGEYFIHRTGHGLGLEVHEPPFLRTGNRAPLEVGNVFTIEPGVYLPGRFGLRYENTVVLGDRGPEALNKTPRVHRL
jgi:Xaa-Pro aminopeptidase